MAVIDVVRFDGLKNREWLVYKYPSDSLVVGTQLIVQEGQVAIFVKNGAVYDEFYPGTYMLSTENLPLLKQIVNIPFGGRTPFSAEVYFINTIVRLDVNWGTSDPIQLIDPKYYVKLRLRAYGQMGLKVVDPVRMFKNIIGGMQQAEVVRIEKVKSYYRGLLVIKAKSTIADAIITNNISALEISTQLESISEKIMNQIAPDFEEYGLRVITFYVQSINFPDEDFAVINKILEDKAAFEIMGDGRYATKRSFDVYEGAANNESGVAGAFVAGGLGVGAAAGMGGAMRRVIGQPIQNEKAKECPACHTAISADVNFCPTCGADCRDVTCECGKVLKAGVIFCPQCGKKVR